MKLEQILNQEFSAFFAPADRLGDLKRELKSKLHVQGNLVLAPRGPNARVYFMQNYWRNPRILRFESEPELRNQILSINKNNFFQEIGFSTKLREIGQPISQLGFGQHRPQKNFLEWTLIDKHYALLCEVDEGYPLNLLNFQADKTAPSRAYLKLWELFTRLGTKPQAGDTCLELGSAPGGWTYVLDSLEARVTSVDRADLEKAVLVSGRVQHLTRDAFSVQPKEFESLDWFFSDLICFPDRLADYVEEWLQSGKVKNFVCTLKFKGATDWKSIERFKSFGGQLLHLNQNKHELTWYRGERET